LLRKLELNSTFEKFIVYILLKSKDYVDAAKKLKNISKNKTQKEIIVRVTLGLFQNE